VITVLAALQPTLTVGHDKRAIASPIGISGLAHPEQGAVGAVLTGLFTLSLSRRVCRWCCIDRLISRTLVYGLLTAILGLTYVGGVLVLGQVFGGVGGSPPSWAVAGATLAVAALFQPARRRIQAVVDRRFNRRKYNAARTVEAFSLRLRDQVDLDALSTELLAVVDQTIQPTRASLCFAPRISGHHAPGPKLPTPCAGWCSSGALQGHRAGPDAELSSDASSETQRRRDQPITARAEFQRYNLK
jgi:hypothetical protein